MIVPRLCRPLRSAGLVLAIGLAMIPAANAACGPLVQRFDGLVREGRIDALREAEAAIFAEPDCSAPQRQRARRNAALAHVQAANARKEPREQLALLEAGEAFAKPWQLMASIGDIRRGLRDHAGASTAYQLALADIADAANVPNPPPPAVVERLHRLAGQERSIAPNFVRGDILVTRSLRNIVIEAAPVPVQFEYNSDQLTTLGKQYAEDLWRILDAQGRPKITLIGHTDPRGSEDYNNALSRRRAEALRKLLIDKGYAQAAIAATGKGETAPLCIEGLAEYNSEQVWQMLRRVEVRFAEGEAPAAVAGATCQIPPRR